MSRAFAALLLTAAVFIAAPSHANEAAVRQAFIARFPGANIDSVTRMPIGGLYEIVFEGQIVYTDEKVNYVMSGNLFDLRGGTERNLTRERMGQIVSQTLAKSNEGAIKRVKGNGKRVIYTFEDPNCPYCKELQKELAKMNDVTVYTFLLPILSQDSTDKSKAIWCSKDRAKAWDDAMLRGVTPAPARKDCETPFDKNAQLAQRFGIRGTPAVYLANGQQIGGYVPADKIEQALSTAAR
ncbi:MAG: DsbC family protein [Rhodospirillaceae bacterium]